MSDCSTSQLRLISPVDNLRSRPLCWARDLPVNWPRSTIRERKPSPPSPWYTNAHKLLGCNWSLTEHWVHDTTRSSRLEVLSLAHTHKKKGVPRQHLCLIHGIRVVRSDWQLTSCNFLNRGMISSLGHVSANYRGGSFVVSHYFFPLPPIPFFPFSSSAWLMGCWPCVGGYSGISAQPSSVLWLVQLERAGKHFVSSPQV